VPENVSFVAIAAGSGHSVGIESDGTLLAWGSDPLACGVFSVPEGNDFVAVAGSWSHNLAVQ
jgi:alpha-tubulin suppressor-like RCC1 family protein